MEAEGDAKVGVDVLDQGTPKQENGKLFHFVITFELSSYI